MVEPNSPPEPEAAESGAAEPDPQDPGTPTSSPTTTVDAGDFAGLQRAYQRALGPVESKPRPWKPVDTMFDRVDDRPPLSAFAGSDLLRFPATAIEQTGRDLYGAIDALLFDALPELSEFRYFEPKSWTGEILSGFGEAAILFPVTGAAGGALKIGKGVSALKHASPIAKTVLGSRAVTGILRGAPIDFIMSPNGAAFSSILQQMPSEMAQSIGNVLGSEPDDSKALKMIRGMLEGAVVGSFAGLLAHWYVKNRRVRGLGRRVTERARQERIQTVLRGEPVPNENLGEYTEVLRELADNERYFAGERGADRWLHWINEATNEEVDAALKSTRLSPELLDELLRVEDVTQASEATRAGYRELEKRLGREAPWRESEAKHLAYRLMIALKTKLAPPQGARPIEEFVKNDEAADAVRRAVSESVSLEETQEAIEKTLFARGKPGVERGPEASAALLYQARSFAQKLGEAVERRRALEAASTAELESIDEQVTELIRATPPQDVQTALALPLEAATPPPAKAAVATTYDVAAGPPALAGTGMGRTAKLFVREPGGTTRTIPVRYGIVEGDSLTPSHDARKGFAKNPLGDPNERKYDDPAEEALRQGVEERATTPEPDFVLSDTPTSTDGPPIVRPNGVVLGGNGRAMGQQLAYQRGGAAAETYRKATREAAARFGISPAEIAGVKNPILVRIISHEEAGAPGALSRALNEDFKLRRSFVSDAVSRGTRLTPEAAMEINALTGPEGTLADVFNSDKGTEDLKKILIRAGILSSDELPEIVRDKRFTKSGREAIETALLASAVPDVRTLNELAPSYQAMLLRALPQIVRLAEDPELGFRAVLKDALDGIVEMRRSGQKTVDMALAQQSFVPEPWKENPRAIALMRALVDDTGKEFQAKMQRLSKVIADVGGGQSKLFGAALPTPAEAFDEVFEAPRAAVEPEMAADLLDEVDLGMWSTPTPANRVFYRAPGKPRRELVFQSPFDRMLWIARSREHDLALDAKATLEAMGVSEAQAEGLFKRVRELARAAKPMEVDVFGEIREGLPIPKSGIEDEVRAMFGAKAAKRAKLEAETAKAAEELGGMKGAIERGVREAGAETIEGGPVERRASIVRPQEISGLPRDNVRGAEGTAIAMDREGLRAAISAGQSGAEAFVAAAKVSGADESFLRYLTRIGRSLFDDVDFLAVPGKGGAYIPRAITAGRDLVLLGQNLQKGDFVAAEELFHKLWQHLTPSERATVRGEWQAAVRRGETGYRYLNEEEYWAHTAAEAAIQGYERMRAGGQGGFKGLASSLWNGLVEAWSAARTWLGIGRTQDFARQFLAGRRAKGVATEGVARYIRSAEVSYDSLRRSIIGQLEDPVGAAEAEKAARAGLDPTAAPYKMSEYELDQQKLRKGNWNNTYMTGSRDANEVVRIASAMATNYGTYDPSVVVHTEEHTARVMAELAAILGNENVDLFTRELRGSPAQILEQLGRWAEAMQNILVGQSERAAILFRELTAKPEAGRSILEKAQVVEAIEFVEQLAKHVELYRAQSGRNMRWLQNPNTQLSAEAMERVQEVLRQARGGADPAKLTKGLEPAEAAAVDAALDRTVPVRELAKDPAAFEEWLRQRGGEKKIDQILEAYAKDLSMGLEPTEQAAKLLDLARRGRMPNGWDFLSSIYLKHVLSGLRTHAAVLLSETASAMLQPGRHWLGAGLGRLIATAHGDRELAKKYAQVMAEAQRAYGHLFDRDTVREAFSAAKRAYLTGEGFFANRNIVSQAQGRSAEALTQENLRAWFQLQFDNSATAARSIYNPKGPVANGISYLFTKTEKGRGIGYANKMSYISTRPLVAADEFVRTLSGRAAMRSILEQQAMELFPHNPGQWREEVARRMKIAIDDQGQLLSRERLLNDVDRAAEAKGLRGPERTAWKEQEVDRFLAENKPIFDAAEFVRHRGNEAAATLPPVYGSLSSNVQHWVSRQGWPRLFLPFIGSSVSLARTAGQHYDFFSAYRAWAIRKVAAQKGEPLNLSRARRRIAQELLSEDPRVRSEAMGRLSAGILAFGFLGTMAAQEVSEGLPLITGALSSSKPIRDLQKARGLQEYSIYVPGAGYVSFARMDPFSTVLGTIADVINYSKLHPNTSNDSLTDIGGSVITALAHNFQNKSYLMGVTTILEALHDEDPQRLLRALGNMASSMAVPNIVPQQGMALLGDDALHQARTFILDDARRKLPYFNEGLPVQRDLLGQAIPRQRFVDGGFLLPFAYNAVSDDVVRIELQQLGHAFQTPFPDRFGLDLRDVYNDRGRQAYDRWLELAGTVRIGGKTLHGALREKIQSREYQALPRHSELGIESPRIGILSSIRERYHALGWEKAVPEFPEVQGRVRQAAIYRLGNQMRGQKVSIGP